MSRKASFFLPLGLLLLLVCPFFMPSNYVSDSVYLEIKSATTSGVSNGHTLINKTYVQSGLQTATAVIQQDDGSFILGGYQANTTSDGLMLLRADSEGNYEWNKTYCPGALRRMVQCRDGGFALLGMVWPEGSEQDDWLVARLNSTYDLQWNWTYGGQGFDYPSGIIELDDGFMIGGSYTNISRGDLDYMLIRTDRNGTQLWNVTFGDSEIQWFRQMIHCSDGGFLICGYTWNTSDLWDIWLVKTDASGHHLWNSTYSTDEYDTANDIVELRGGGYALVGAISDGYVGEMLLLRTDANGNQLWNKTFAHGANQTYEGFTILETPDNGFCLRGRNTEDVVTTYWLLRTDSIGNSLWEYRLGAQSVVVLSIVNAEDGGFITAGMAGEYGTEEWDFHLMLFPELSWVEAPIDQLWFTNATPIPSYKLNAISAAPIQSWYVNDTHFNIDGSGLLTNTTLLKGVYFLHVTVMDTVGNVLAANLRIVATEKTLPVIITTTTGPYSPFNPIPPPPVHFILSVLAAALIIVIVVIAAKVIHIRSRM